MSRKRMKSDTLLKRSLLSVKDKKLLKEAWETTRANHGNEFTFYLPGMIRYGQRRGRYPAISITGNQCDLQCEHCKGKLLEPMIKVKGPEGLVRVTHRLARDGIYGVLLTGGSDKEGRLPWNKYIRSIEKIHRETSLYISIHSGFADRITCSSLKKAGVSQALIDVMGSKKAATQIYHLSGLKPVLDALEAIVQSGLELVPHIVAGLYYGNIEAEYKALEIIRCYHPKALVIVVLTPLKGTPMNHVLVPSPIEIGRLIARARLMMPEVPISLGCERPRNRDGWLMERLAIWAGATRMAIWSDDAIKEAKNVGLTLRFQATCCSLNYRSDYCGKNREHGRIETDQFARS